MGADKGFGMTSMSSRIEGMINHLKSKKSYKFLKYFLKCDNELTSLCEMY